MAPLWCPTASKRRALSQHEGASGPRPIPDAPQVLVHQHTAAWTRGRQKCPQPGPSGWGQEDLAEHVRGGGKLLLAHGLEEVAEADLQHRGPGDAETLDAQ